MGLQLFGDCKLPFLGRGLMIPNFQSVGKTEVAIQVFTMSLMYTARKYLKRLSILIGILSCQYDLTENYLVIQKLLVHNLFSLF